MHTLATPLPLVREAYVPITVLSMGNQRDFSRISKLINNTYDAQDKRRDNTNDYKLELKEMDRKYQDWSKKLKSNPFGVFGGSPLDR